MKNSEQSTRDWILVIALSGAIGAFFGVVVPNDFMIDFIDATWWRVLPWVLLALLWLGFGFWIWRGRRRDRERKGTESDQPEEFLRGDQRNGL